MATRKVLKITPILVTLNILVLLIIIGFYTFRLVKYYNLEHNHKSDEKITLYETVKKHQSFLDLTKGLIFDEEKGIYYYKGKVDDNYVSYSGLLYRIHSIDSDGNLKLVSENNLTIMYNGLNKGFKDSYVNKWLNKSEDEHSGIYESTLIDSDSLLAKTSLCEDNVTDLEKVECTKVNNDYTSTLLSMYDYRLVGGANSYLNNGEAFLLNTSNDENEYYYVTSNGEMSINKSDTRVLGIRPVITVSAKTICLSGNGTLEKPYVIEKHKVSTLADAYVGSYISFNDSVYRIVEKNDKGVKVALDGILMKDEENELKYAFDSASNTYSKTTTLGKYLNETFYNSIASKDSIISSSWYVGNLSLDNLDYTRVYEKKNSANVGLLTLGDFFVHEQNNVFMLSRGIEANNIINVINEDGNVYGDVVTSKYRVRPSFYLDGKIEITTGVGSNEGPYELGGSDEEKGEK